MIDLCLNSKGARQDFPFDDTTMVFKVAEKMFALINLTQPFSINLKCAPEYAVTLRQKYASITPGYHMNKKHWNTILLDGDVPDQLQKELVAHSYDLTLKKLPRTIQHEILHS